MDTWRHKQWYFECDEVICLSVRFRCIDMHRSTVFGNDLFEDRRWIRLQTNEEARQR